MFTKNLENGNNVEFYREVLFNMKELLTNIEKNEREAWAFVGINTPFDVTKIFDLIRRNKVKFEALRNQIFHFQDNKDKINHEELDTYLKKFDEMINEQFEQLRIILSNGKAMSPDTIYELLDSDKIEKHRSLASSLIEFISTILLREINKALLLCK